MMFSLWTTGPYESSMSEEANKGRKWEKQKSGAGKSGNDRGRSARRGTGREQKRMRESASI